jgi:hypothetical protein
MNEREFDAYLREALREPAAASVPEDIRSAEISRAVSIVVDELLWGEVDIDDGTDGSVPDQRGPDGAQHDHDLSVWDEARPDGPWDDDDASPVAAPDDDPLLASEPLDHIREHDVEFGVHDPGIDRGPLGHGGADAHDTPDHESHHDGS